MPEVVNTSFLGESAAVDDASSSAETMIKVDDVSMVFNMASETMNNLKEYAIALARRELRFKEFRALDHISLEVKKGDVFGILGTNGSGKSTLLKIIAGVLEPTEGTCTVNGNIAPLIELGAGFDMELTARENIYLNGALLGYSKHFISDHFDEIVDFAEIEKFLDMPLKNYSSGMVARIAFAIATVIVPEILIVDEVLSVGDFMFQQKCERRINTLIKEHGVTVLIVSHSNDQIERLCNKAIWIEKGHERIAGSAHEVCQVYRMLGGHFGSAEAEQQIFELLEQPASGREEDRIETFAGETRYSTSVKVMEALPEGFASDNVILAPGIEPAACLLANALSSVDHTPVLLTKADALPEIVEHKLRTQQPPVVTVVGGPAFISAEVVEQVRRATPTSEVVVLDADTEELLALQVFKHVPRANWGTKAVLTYKECTGDLLSFLPYTYRERTPVLFNAPGESLSDELKAALTENGFDELLVLGGAEAFSDEVIASLEKGGAHTTRFCGKNAFDANRIILEWTAQHAAGDQTAGDALLLNVWDPADALAIGPLTQTRHGFTLLVDMQDLDSVVLALDTIEKRRSAIGKLVFFGGATQFSDLDKTLLAKKLG